METQAKAPAIAEEAADATEALKDAALPVKAAAPAKDDGDAPAKAVADSVASLDSATGSVPVSYSPASGTSAPKTPSDAPRAPDGTRSRAPFSVLVPANDDGKRRDEEEASV